MPTYETLQYIGSFDLVIDEESLGDVVIAHGGGYFDFWKLDLPYETLKLRLTFKVLPDSGKKIDAGASFGGAVTRYQYIRDFYRRNRIQGIKPFIISGPGDGVSRYFFFSDPRASYSLAMSALYTSGLQLSQIRLAGTTAPSDPLSTPALII